MKSQNAITNLAIMQKRNENTQEQQMTYELLNSAHTDSPGHALVCCCADGRSTPPSTQLNNLAPIPQPAASYSLSSDTWASTSTTTSTAPTTTTTSTTTTSYDYVYRYYY